MKGMTASLTRADLQNRARVKGLIRSAASALGEPLSDAQVERLATYVISKRIDPRNKLQLLKLYNTFR
jgi:hypothetical protein